MLRVFAEESADAAVEIFGVFTDDEEVDIFACFVSEWCADAGV